MANSFEQLQCKEDIAKVTKMAERILYINELGVSSTFSEIDTHILTLSLNFCSRNFFISSQNTNQHRESKFYGFHAKGSKINDTERNKTMKLISQSKSFLAVISDLKFRFSNSIGEISVCLQ